MLIYAIVPARSGSKGFKDKNIQLLNGIPLIGYSIGFAKNIGCDKVICSTDSERYKSIAESLGADVPFLRCEESAGDTAMEQDILKDLYKQFIENNIELPDIIVWLRPTFVFRDLSIITEAIRIIKENPEISAVRTVCESESRLYSLMENKLIPQFDDKGKSMIRRQDIGTFYKVFSTDVFRFNKDNLVDDFLGRNVIGLPIPKICGLDIDDEDDFHLVEALVNAKLDVIKEYIFV